MKDTVLIIFVGNPVERKVKTRLAKSIGSHKALLVYLELQKHIRGIIRDLACDKYVFYDDEINVWDPWENDKYFKRQQRGNDLGKKMYQIGVIIGRGILIIGTLRLPGSKLLLRF